MAIVECLGCYEQVEESIFTNGGEILSLYLSLFVYENNISMVVRFVSRGELFNYHVVIMGSAPLKEEMSMIVNAFHHR